MPPASGTSFLLAINTGSVATPVWTTIGGQRDGTLNMNTDSIDTSSKDSSGFHEELAGMRNFSVDFDALLIEDDVGYDAVEDMWLSGTEIQIQLTTAAAHTYVGLCVLSTLSLTFPNEAEVTASGSLTGSGALVKT